MDIYSQGIQSKCKGGRGDIIHSIGGSGGKEIALLQPEQSVKSIYIYTGSINSTGTIIRGIELIFTNDKKLLAGKRTTSFEECHFEPGEKLSDEVVLCGDGRGTRSGFFKIGDKIKAGSCSKRDQYKFDTRDRILKGLIVNAGSDIDSIALIVSKKVKKVKLINVDYKDFNEDIERGENLKMLQSFTDTNESSVEQVSTYTVTYQKSKWVSKRECSTSGHKVNLGVEYDVGTALFLKTKFTANYEFSHSGKHENEIKDVATNTVSETHTVRIPPYTKMKHSCFHYLKEIDLPYVETHEVELEDGTKVRARINGTVKGVMASMSERKEETEAIN